ncbi:MAG: Gfo/Idh/MocA family oxidoreductase [Niabella sp.]|nr:Gfo/Idh/MocA family oxidoreductase [Niabella sp.]
MSGKTRFAVVGYGHMGKRHVTVIGEHPDCALTAVVDMHPQQELPGIPFYRDLDHFLESSAAAETDVVVIATPNGLHAQQALKCLDARKHVLIEKPMALNSADAEAIVAKAADVQRQVFVMMQNRFSPVSTWLKEVVDSGVLGKIFLVQVNCFWNRDERYYKKGSWHGTKELDGGVLFTQFSHFIDLLLWCFGDLTNIQAKLKNFGHGGSIEIEDTGIVQFDFVNGGMGCLNYTTAVWDKNLESSITVIAENGSVKVGGQYMERMEYCHIKDFKALKTPVADNSNKSEVSDSVVNHVRYLDRMLKQLWMRNEDMHVAVDGVTVVHTIERIMNQADR